MEHDDLTVLLRRADEAVSAPPRTNDVAIRSRRRHSRRAKARAGMAAIAAMLVLGVVISRFTDRKVHVTVAPVPNPTADVIALRQDFERLQREGDAREAVVRKFLNRRPLRRAAPIRSDPLIELEWQREHAALILVQQGDRFANEMKLSQPAALAYRQARDTFPGTRWGSIADVRLAEMN